MGAGRRLGCALLCAWAAGALGAPAGKGEAPVLDPLLRRPWFEEDLARTRGEVHRLSRLLERSGSQFPIRDSAGRTFRVDLRGRVSFSPFDGDWRAVVPRRSESALALAEAEGLYARGAREHAVFLLKAVASMGRLPAAGGGLRADSARAARRLSELARRETFAELDARTDPFVLYDDSRDETIVQSYIHRLRIVLPGPWRYQYGRERDGRSQWRERVMYLGQQDLVVLIGLDEFSGPGVMSRLGGLVDLWDRRRSLGPQRKREVDFVREPDPTSDNYCLGRNVRRFSPAQGVSTPRLEEARARRLERMDVPACRLLRASLTRVTRAPNDAADSLERFRTGRGLPSPQRVSTAYLEFYHLRPGRGLFIEIRLPAGQEVLARETLGRVLNGLSLY